MRTTEIQHKPAVYSLIRLHAELAGKIVENKRQAEALARDIGHVEAVLKMLDPAFNVRTIAAKRRNKGNRFFKKGQCWRHVLDVLRVTDRPLTSTEVAVAVLRGFGVTEPSRDDIRAMFSAVHSSLKNYRGKTVEAIGDGKPVRWRLLGDLVPLPVAGEINAGLRGQR